MIASVSVIIVREFRRLNRFALGGILLLLIVQIGGSYILQVWLWDYPLLEWLTDIFISTVLILLGGTTITLVVPLEEDGYLEPIEAEAVHTQ